MVSYMSKWDEQYKINKANARWLKKPPSKKRKPYTFNLRVGPNGYDRNKELNGTI